MIRSISRIDKQQQTLNTTIMKKIMMLWSLTLLLSLPVLAQNDRDWANFGRFAKENAALTKAPDAVFMGNSITQNWRSYHPDYFASHNYAGRGIGGQVTSQMLCRFRADVLDLHPKVVVIFAGTNDIAQNDGAISNEHIMDNIISMCELAQGHGIKVILCSVLPASAYRWRPDEFNQKIKPAEVIRALNGMIQEYAATHGCAYVDFWSAMANENGGLPTSVSEDGVHPLPDAYYAMEEMITPVIERLL